MDVRVGAQGATTSTKKLHDLVAAGYLAIEPADFAVVTIHEEIGLGPQLAGRFGLRSKYARKGLIATTGPQIDPGYRGRLVLWVDQSDAQSRDDSLQRRLSVGGPAGGADDRQQASWWPSRVLGGGSGGAPRRGSR